VVEDEWTMVKGETIDVRMWKPAGRQVWECEKYLNLAIAVL